jgi:hypothetical protein
VIEAAKRGDIPQSDLKPRVLQQKKIYPKLNLGDDDDGRKWPIPLNKVLAELMRSKSVKKRNAYWQDFLSQKGARLKSIIEGREQPLTEVQFQAISSIFDVWEKEQLRSKRQEAGRKGGATKHAQAEAKKAAASKNKP